MGTSPSLRQPSLVSVHELVTSEMNTVTLYMYIVYVPMAPPSCVSHFDPLTSYITHAWTSGIEMFHKSLDEGQAGDQLGALLRGVKREEIRRGMVLCAPGTMTPHSKFKAQVYVLKKEEGGRHTPFVSKYEPHLFTRTADMTGAVELPEGGDTLT